MRVHWQADQTGPRFEVRLQGFSAYAGAGLHPSYAFQVLILPMHFVKLHQHLSARQLVFFFLTFVRPAPSLAGIACDGIYEA